MWGAGSLFGVAGERGSMPVYLDDGAELQLQRSLQDDVASRPHEQGTTLALTQHPHRPIRLRDLKQRRSQSQPAASAVSHNNHPVKLSISDRSRSLENNSFFGKFPLLIKHATIRKILNLEIRELHLRFHVFCQYKDVHTMCFVTSTMVTRWRLVAPTTVTRWRLVINNNHQVAAGCPRWQCRINNVADVANATDPALIGAPRL